MYCCAPDDEALGPGGTLIKHRKKAMKLTFFYFQTEKEQKKILKNKIL